MQKHFEVSHCITMLNFFTFYSEYSNKENFLTHPILGLCK